MTTSTTVDYSKKAMLVTLTLSKWTASKKDKRATADVQYSHGAADGSVRVTKSLIVRERLDRLKGIDRAMREYFDSVTLPWDGNGRRVLPSAMFFEFKQRMSEMEAQREEIVRDFIRDYPDYVDEARDMLNGLFDEADYPPQDEMAGKFSVALNVEPVPTGNSLHVDIAEEYLSEQRKAIEERVTGMMRQAHRDLYERLHEVVAHLRDSMEEGKSFRASTIDKIVELCDLIPDLSIQDDMRLKDIATKAKAAVTRFPVDTIRDNKTAAKMTQNELSRQVKAIEDGMAAYFN